MSFDVPKDENFTLNNQQIPSHQIQEWDHNHLIHPWEDLAGDADEHIMVSKAKGIHLYNSEGRPFIDGPGGMWCVNIGYGRTEMAEAIAEQVMRMNYSSPWFTANEPSAILAHQLADRAPGDLNNVFFSNGGSDAVDSALRFVQYRNNVLGRPNKKKVIARQKGYHGSSFLSASVSGKERDRAFMDTYEDMVHFLPNVNPYLRPAEVSVEEWCDAKVKDLEDAISTIGASSIAAFIAEPVLSSGGVIIPPDGYHERTLRLCRAHDIVYISDEVVTGFGRLGHWFASKEVFGIVPDIITCAKGLTSGYLPMGAMIISDRLIADIKDNVDHSATFNNGYTYSGHPVCAAAALKNIEIIEEENILGHVRDVAPHFQARLKAIGEKYDIIGDARGIGMIGCLEGAAAPGASEEVKLKIDYEFGDLMDKLCEKRGLLVRPLINMCVFSPPLIINRDEIDQMFDILDEAVAEVERQML